MNLRESTFNGIGITQHIAIGKAVVFREAVLPEFPEHCADREAEAARLRDAIIASKDQLTLIISNTEAEQRTIMESQLTLAEDPAIYNQAAERIRQNGFSAEKAIYDVTQELYEEFSSMDDSPYLQECAADVEDVGR